jgi:TatD family-associated radical SAM protein
MEVNILKGLPGCSKARGVAVVIDVFRATSTIACLALSKPASLHVAGTVDQSDGERSSILFSEIPELNPDHDNSPLNALGGEFQGQALTIQSRNGTTAIDAVRHCDEVVLGAFINADAVVEYLRRLDAPEVSLVAIGHIKVPEETEEDNACADYIKARLTGAGADIESYRTRLRERIVVRRSDPLSPQSDLIEEDLALCSMIGILNVVPRAVFHEDGPIEMIPEAVPASVERRSLFLDQADLTSLTVEQIAEKGRGLGVLRTTSTGEAVASELAGYCAELILLSEGSIQKALSFVFAFFNGYTEKRKLDWKHEPFMRHILEGLMRLLYSEPRSHWVPPNEARRELTRRIVHAFRECPQNMQAFITEILGTGSSNYGRLDGRVVPTTQIIYHKREANEFSVNITNRCPNSCTFCIRDIRTGWRESEEDQNLYLEREPSEEEVLDAVRDELAKWPEGCLVKICGYGEPVERMDVVLATIDAIKTASPDFFVQLNTSGWPLLDYGDDRVFEKLSEHGLDSVSVSLNAPNKELYDRIVRPGCFEYRENAFEDTVKCIRLARDHGLAVKATAVMIKPIEEEIDALESFVEGLGVEFVPREYVGRALPGIDPEGVVPLEVKVLDVQRDEVMAALADLGAERTATGISKMYHYEIPDDEADQREILRVIESNPPELRQLHPILKIVKRQIEGKARLIDRLGLLRIIVEQNTTRLVYKEPVEIGTSLKREREFSLPMESPEKAMMYMHRIGLRLFRFMEKNRERYVLGRTIFDVDTWPRLGTYLKVESFDVVEIFAGLHRLGLDPSEASGIHAEELFKSKEIPLDNLHFTDDELQRMALTRE